MNRILFLATTFVAFLTIGSCKKDDSKSVAPVGRVQVSFSNYVGADPVTMGGVRYTNAAGNSYSVDMLKYYISHFTLIRDDSTEIVSDGHELIDNADSSSRFFSLDSIPNGRYRAVRFYLGVDYNHNHSGDQFGDLDPIHGMIWTWNTGYIYFKHEGVCRDNSGANKSFAYHLGTDRGLTQIEMPIPAFEVSANTRKINMKFDLNALYAGPSPMNFVEEPFRMSTSSDDEPWIKMMTRMVPGAFTVGSVE